MAVLTIEGNDGVIYQAPDKHTLIKEACRRSHQFLCRCDQPGWVWDSPLHKTLFEAFESALAAAPGEGQYLGIEVPIRHGKSECITVRGAAWAMLQKNARVLVACNTKQLAERFSRKTKEVLRRLGVEPGDVDGISNWTSPSGATLYAVGAGGAIEGMGFDYVFIDDLIRSRQEADSPTVLQARWDWLTDSLWGRLEPGAKVWMIMSRWSEADPIGRIKAGEWISDQWRFVTLKALAEEGDPLGRQPGEALFPERWPADHLIKLREANPLNFEARYQQSPVPRGGDVFLADKIALQANPEISSSWRSVIALDLGYGETGDYTALARMWQRPDKTYLAEIHVCRMEAGARNQWILGHCQGRGVRVLIPQDGGAGKEAAKTLGRLLQAHGVSCRIRPVRGGSKEVRADPLAGAVNMGLMTFVDSKDGRYARLQLQSFPRGANDDVVDALADAYNEIAGGGWTTALGDLVEVA